MTQSAVISFSDPSSRWRIARLLLVVLLAGGLAPTASAGDRDHRDRHDRDHRYRDDGYYNPPPVVYGAPYYAPPPVVYGPSIGIAVPGLTIGIH
jgi:hypothetical protein